MTFCRSREPDHRFSNLDDEEVMMSDRVHLQKLKDELKRTERAIADATAAIKASCELLARLRQVL